MSARSIDVDSGGWTLYWLEYRHAALAAIATVIALAIVLSIVIGIVTQSVQSVQISGALTQVSETELKRAVKPLLVKGLFRIDMESIRRAVLEVAWVGGVTVRRVWPDKLDITVVEQNAIARWLSGGYLEPDGTHIQPDSAVGLDGLPVLAGSEGAQQRVLALHHTLERVLAPLGMRLVATELTPRGVLHATLDKGLHLVMRPDAIEGNVAIGIRTIARRMADRLHTLDRIDFRYPNGFAVRLRGEIPNHGKQG